MNKRANGQSRQRDKIRGRQKKKEEGKRTGESRRGIGKRGEDKRAGES